MKLLLIAGFLGWGKTTLLPKVTKAVGAVAGEMVQTVQRLN